MRSIRAARASLFVIVAALLPASARAQTPLSSQGLGYPLLPLDARARGLGGIGLGLPGGNLSLVNPAEDATLLAPAFGVTVQPDFYSGTAGDFVSSGRTQRFPVLHAVFPFARRFSASLGYGAFLDRRFATEVSDTQIVGGSPNAVTDRFSSSGGVSRLRLALAARAGKGLSAGLGADVYTGAARDSTIRILTGLAPSVRETVWAYRGVGVTAGARWEPSEALRVSAAVTTPAKLRAEPEGDSLVAAREFDLPVTADVGASGRIAQSTVVALAARWSGWSSADAQLRERGGARDVRSASAGIEYEGVAFAGKTLPLRLGARYAELPFRWQGNRAQSTFPNERALSAGLGARLASGAAGFDLGVERGKRGGANAGIDETFWRLSFSLSLLGR